MSDVDDQPLRLDSSLQPPMANGEVLFDAPWQGRVFGIARSMAEQGLYSWDEFRAHLIEQIGEWDRTAQEADDYRYYDHFLAALSGLLAEKGLVSETSLADRFREFQVRPHGHDH